VKFQHVARMLVGDLPLVAVLERERLESIAFLSTARPLSVSSLVLLSTIRSKCHESVMSLVMSTMTRLPPHTQMREGEAPQLQCFAPISYSSAQNPPTLSRFTKGAAKAAMHLNLSTMV